jgi:hypothetical protein
MPDRTASQGPRSFFICVRGAVGLLFTLALLLLLLLLLAPSASASYEQVATFGASGEGELGEGTSGLAVNRTGAGGVAAGTVYAVNRAFGGDLRRYSAKGEFLGEVKIGDSSVDVAVDQTTGNVYVLLESGSVWIFNADGSKLITKFGEMGAFGESFDEGPEKFHFPWAIVVDSSGVVYVADFANGARTMLFEPQSPGDYEHYVYTGRANDIDDGGFSLALDSAGNIYMSAEQTIYAYSLAEPADPVCEYEFAAGGIQDMTVNPESGEVFYYTYKDKKIHQLAACNGQGDFVETTTFGLSPKPSQEINALALNPDLAWEASRPPGILYAAHAHSPILGYIFALAEVHPPSVESQSVSSVTSTTATLGAQINPKGSPTRYAFQYLTEAAYEANEPSERFAGSIEAPLGGADLGSGQEALSAAVSLVGLEPDTEYRYRVIASSHCDPEKAEEACEDVGDAQAFHTFPLEAPGLPDNRAWELVSPAQKFGGEVIPADPQTASCKECKPASFGGTGGFPKQSSPDGEAVVYQGFPFSTTEGAAIFNEYLSRRTPSGWQTTILSPSLHTDSYKAFNAELTQALLAQGNPSLTADAPAEYPNLYAQDAANPLTLSPLLGFEPPNRCSGLGCTSVFDPTFAGASADFSQLFFEANDALTGETPFAPEAVDPGPGTADDHPKNLYEWSDGQLRLVNVLPGNTETVPGAEFGSGVQLESGDPNNPVADFTHAISDDGSRVFWSDETGQVYVRENGESTIAIPDPGKFLTASVDGSKLLLSNGHLYDLGAEEPTVQEIADLGQGEGGFQGIVGQSEDLSHIYFVDTAVLTGEEENDHGASAEDGKYNLYTWHEGTLAFIAALLPEDNSNYISSGDWSPSAPARSAEASPDGRWVSFISRAPLTGYDNTGICTFDGFKKEYVSGPCLEVFLYDSASGELLCPSCNPSGARPLGGSILRLLLGAEGSLPQPRYLTDDGRLYFDSRDSLTPFDTNEGVEDVYQYEPEGVGSCTREGGCVSLISAGHEPIDSNLLAVDETGKNVFFTTRDQLVLKDRDDLIDLYVAREDGGIAAETEAGTPGCQGEACQPLAVVPNDPTPGTATLEGAGNVDQRPRGRCSKGKVRRRGRCVKKRRHTRAHRQASRNRGGAR